MAEQIINLNYLIDPFEQFMNLNGKPLVGGFITLYLAGTDEKYISYQNFDFVQNPFKVPINSDGRVTIIVDVSNTYDAYVYSSNGNLVVSRLNISCPGGVAGGGLQEVSHDETLTGKGTLLSPLGVSPLINLAVDDTMTAYEATVSGRDALVLGVNSDWFDETFSGAWSGKVDYDEFSACCSAVNSSLENKVDNDYLFENYYNKTDTHNIFLPRSAYTNSGDYYTKSETYNKLEIENFINGKQDTLTFGYDEFSNISSINNSALWGAGGGSGSSGGSDIWISGAKIIAPDTIDLFPGTTAQSLSSFTVSGNKNHCIAVKGGIYRVPDINQWVSAISSTNYFTTQNEFYSSALMLSGAITYVSANAGDEFPASANDAITAYQTYSGDYYTTADANTMSSMFSGAIDYVSANAGGGSVTGDYVPLVSSYTNGNNITSQKYSLGNLNYSAKYDWGGITTATQTILGNAGLRLSANVTSTNYSAISDCYYRTNGLSFFNEKNGNQYWINFKVDRELPVDEYLLPSACILLASNDSAYNGEELIFNNDIITHNYFSGYEISANSATWDNIISASNVVVANSGSWGEGHAYTGIDPIQVNNVDHEISITGESLSAGPGIDLFASGGYVVISANGGTSFPITSTDGSHNYTFDARSSALYLTTATGAAGSTTTFNVRGVRYDAYPSTDVSASWFDIINAGNAKSNVYCVQFSNAMTAIDLANYSAYDKVTVVHSNDYTPVCNLNWKTYTKVCPSGFWCELVKGKDEQNDTEWYFTNSGWINNVEWDWN